MMATMKTSIYQRNPTNSEEDEDLTIIDKGELYDGDQDKAGPKTASLKMRLFVIVSAIITIMALRNNLTYHLQHFWGASGDFWQKQWDNILYTFGDDPFVLFVYGTTLVSYLVYWIVGGLNTLMVVFNKPAFVKRYKVQPGTNVPVDNFRLMKCILFVNFNQIIIGIPLTMCAYYLITLRGYDQSPKLPTFGRVLVEIMGCLLVQEAGFYYSHRMLHHPLFYKRYHKMHHEWQSPISIAAIYCHPFEHVLSNMGPVILGPVAFGCHTATIWLWVCTVYMNTLSYHSGYHLPFLPSPEAHDFHHLKFNQCYGLLGILDLLHGTDAKFRASKCFSRHVTMLSLTPPREVFPDVDPNTKVRKGNSL